MRLDVYLTERYNSRNKAADAINSGEVLVGGKIVKPSYIVKPDSVITFVENDERFVSKGGYKLAKAIADFSLDCKGLVAADIGASTGGFTDCMLQNGAKLIYAIDVGINQLHDKLKGDNRVKSFEKINARTLNKKFFNDSLDCAVVDVSFISVKHIIPALSKILDSRKFAVVLIKPQFECENKNISASGIVKDLKVHKSIIKDIANFSAKYNLFFNNISATEKIKGKNIEYPVLLIKDKFNENFEKSIDNFFKE